MTRGDMVGCQSCRHSYQGADLNLRCRVNGLLASKENAEDCKRYERETGSDDWITVSLCGGCNAA